LISQALVFFILHSPFLIQQLCKKLLNCHPKRTSP
jgi:hypothetical protein